MEQFLDLVKTSVILRILIAVILVVTVCYMLVCQIPIPESVGLWVGTLIGFLFGGAEAAAARAKMKETE